MLGAIAGDIIGSIYEHRPVKTTEFPLFGRGSRFTDDTVLTAAIADCIMKGGDYGVFLKRYGRAYPGAGYGGSFARWLSREGSEPYNSWGNGSAMRVSPVGFAFGSLEEVLSEASKSAEVTHNHPEGVRGAQAAAAAVYMARDGASKGHIRTYITEVFGYDLERGLDEIRPSYSFDVSCRGTVPPAITAFLESDGFEDAVRKAVSLGGDSDTLACIAGGIAQAFYGEIPAAIVERVRALLAPELWDVAVEFSRRYDIPV